VVYDESMTSRWAISLGALLLAGCFDDPVTSNDSAASDDDETSTTADTGDELMLGGTWTGSWFHEGESGGLTLELYHTGGSMVTGNATFETTVLFQCISEGNVTATLEGDQLTGTTTSNDDVMTFNGTVGGDQIQGTFEITAGDCGLGLTGELGLSREP
jgi:hypothetical protein